MDLFDQKARQYFKRNAPLASRLRPEELSAFVGQQDLVGEKKFLRQMIESDQIRSLIFWGPPGTGKTTLARIIAKKTGRHFEALSAVNAGVKDIKEITEQAKSRLKFEDKGTILFIDEIHRFNKGQQDALLHAVEDGILTLIGATTENPSFEINSALLSRCQILVLRALEGKDLNAIIDRALTDETRGFGAKKLKITREARELLVSLAYGDARTLLNFLELSAIKAEADGTDEITPERLREAVGKRAVLYDQHGEEHYNLASALIKSMRGSDPHAAIYYLARMLEGGEDPLFIARRLVIFASEDIGNADPQALQVAVNAQQAVHFIGMPEGMYPLSQTTLYLATAPKSNSAGMAYYDAMKQVKQFGHLPTPLHIRNAPTKFMKDLGYGAEYRYPHDYEANFVAEDYLPEKIQNMEFYKPGERGFEREILKRMEFWKKLKMEGKDRP